MEILVNDFGTQFTNFLDANRVFYRAVVRRIRPALARAGLEPSGDATVTVLLTEGLKSNQGMTLVVGSVADAIEPAFVLSAGDDSLAGVGLEQWCVDELARAVKGHAMIVAPGNHDSPAARRAMLAHDFTVLAGEPIERAGIRVLGDSDPRVTRSLTVTTDFVRAETVAEMSARLARTACKDPDRIPVVVVNQPAGLRDVVDQGCTDLAIAGATERRVSSQSSNGRRVTTYLASSTGGATVGEPDSLLSSLGQLRTEAELTILTFGAVSRRPLQYQIVTVGTDGSVTVSQPQPFPYGSTPAGRKELAAEHR
jgi:hypothetical protein